MASLSTFLDSEASLIQEAALALPHTFDKCTHSLGQIRQAVHLCLTCAVPRGLCSACSVACHGEHEQIELFPKRAFRCDCPSRVGDQDCTLHRGVVADIPGNKYGQNFDAKFCRCHRPYDAKRERETMVQCVVCEDWFHESCLRLRTRPTEGRPSLEQHIPASDDAEVDSNLSNDLPLPLLPSSSYESLVCGACVLSNGTLQKWAGTTGFTMIVKHDDADVTLQVEDGGIDPRWKILNGKTDETSVEVDGFSEPQGRKHPLAKDEGDHVDEKSAKRMRIDHSASLPVGEPLGLQGVEIETTCLAPPPNPVAQRILNSLRARIGQGQVKGESQAEEVLGEGDIFLAERWREKWCQCPKCFPDLERHPYLLEEEETYEPPEDPDSALSLEELGMRALQTVPRDRAIDGIHAYNAMRDELIAYLRPFAEEGRVVREEDVRQFFERKSQDETA